MNYLIETVKYCKRNFLKMFALLALPAILIAYANSPSSVFEFLLKFNNENFTSFFSVYKSITEINVFNFVIIAVAMVILGLVVAGLMGSIERDIRVGQFTLRGFGKNINNNFFPVALMLLLCVVGSILIGVFSALFFYMWHIIAAKVALGLSIVTTVLFFSLLIVLLAPGLLWVATMIFCGFKPVSALSTAIRDVKGRVFNIITAIVVPLLILFTILYVLKYFKVPEFVFLICSSIVNVLLIMHLIVLMFIVYADVYGVEREDLKKDMFWKKDFKGEIEE